MAKNVELGMFSEYSTFPEGTLIDVEDVEGLDPGEVCVVSTGSQGEPLSALSLMAAGESKWLQLHSGDVVVIARTRYLETNGLWGA